MNNSQNTINLNADTMTAFIFGLETQADQIEQSLQYAHAAYGEAMAAYHTLVAAGAPQHLLQERAQMMLALQEDIRRVEGHVKSLRARITAMHPISNDRRQPA